MIGRLTGRIVECDPERVLIDVAGVGYALQVPLSTYYQLASAAERAVSLHVHTHVREDALLLFGFATREERQLFELLIEISGVGPRMALAILSGIGPEDLRRAVREQDRARLQQIPGVGRKTAERLLLELRDKIERLSAGVAPAGKAGPAATGEGALRDDAVSALVNLGFPRERAEVAVRGTADRLGAEASLESLLRGALGRLVG